MSYIEDTICALATPPGMGAIGVIRLSGPKAIDIANAIYKSPKSGKSLNEAKGQTLHFGAIVDGEQLVDEVLISLFRAPHSYTGEDVIEINIHGSTFIQRRMMELLIKRGARPARAGEFTMRAFGNGKMDLSQAEAVGDLIASESEAAHQVAMHQMRGGVREEVSKLRQELIDFASMIELELDFGEEDVEFADRDRLQELLDAVQKTVTRLIGSFTLGNAIVEGIPVAIVGAPNAGKSTLLNALLQEERAIVSDIAGTTRDTVEDEIHLGGLTFRFIDTAGLREATDEIERIGIERSYAKIEQAKVVLYLFDSDDVETSEELNRIDAIKEKAGNKPVIVIANKTDKLSETSTIDSLPVDVKLSAKEKSGIEELEKLLLETVDLKGLNANDTVITNARHYEALIRTQEDVDRIRTGLSTGLSGDLVAFDIRQALAHLGEITGEITTDDLLGNIFANFCIGK
ncbi:MAG: tRNA uridine-5-carboxymethylaminomethyl(34) synthesis GTPase MnmE [Flavobacteriia bacterium]|nr:tRNA uridine-5-carboxymethylaminomethyl(34) synthesis GTPase MnmE [Flavobacteriia bacterium]